VASQINQFALESATPGSKISNAVLVGDSHSYPVGVELFRQGERANNVYLIHRGVIKLTRSESNGHEILLDLRFSGSLIASAAVISEKPHPFAAVTVTRCSLTRWNSQQFLSLIATDSSLSARVSVMLSDEVHDHIARISQLACLPARQRLEQFLWQLCERLGPDQLQPEGTAKLQLPLKHYEIADLLSITPTYLCRLLNELEIENIITRSRGWIIVTKASKLSHMLSL